MPIKIEKGVVRLLLSSIVIHSLLLTSCSSATLRGNYTNYFTDFYQLFLASLPFFIYSKFLNILTNSLPNEEYLNRKRLLS